MTDIDQELYDAVMAKRVPYLRNQGEFHFKDGYAKGFEQAAKVAARIAAERQQVPVSDEELANILQNARSLYHFGEPDGWYRPHNPDWMNGMIAGIRAVRRALGAQQESDQ